ncbi:hypothetical protein QYE76_038050 [Lolium multiflorum]|uniref:Uncharacterized protein n=1 Tax=Lolium multiflorum TaxID=4521 RepID=A0AAD8T826_LOLMU|nr:hypothetical protein QYE76_038050 [Lolium multiflorum]
MAQPVSLTCIRGLCHTRHAKALAGPAVPWAGPLASFGCPPPRPQSSLLPHSSSSLLLTPPRPLLSTRPYLGYMEQATAVVADGGAAAPTQDRRAFLAFVDKAISYIESIRHGNPTWAWTVEQFFFRADTGWRVLVCFVVLCHSAGVPPSVAVFVDTLPPGVSRLGGAWTRKTRHAKPLAGPAVPWAGPLASFGCPPPRPQSSLLPHSSSSLLLTPPRPLLSTRPYLGYMEQATAVVADGGAAAPTQDRRAFLAFVDKAISYIESIRHGNPTWAWTVEQVLKCCRAHPKGVPEDELLMGLDLVIQIPYGYSSNFV